MSRPGFMPTNSLLNARDESRYLLHVPPTELDRRWLSLLEKYASRADYWEAEAAHWFRKSQGDV